MNTLSPDESGCQPEATPPQYVLSLQIPNHSHTITNNEPIADKNMYRRDTKTPWSEEEIIRYQKELRRELDRLTGDNDANRPSNSSCFSCCFRKRSRRHPPPKEEVHNHDEEEEGTKPSTPQMIDIPRPDIVTLTVPDDDAGQSSTNRRESISFNDRLTKTPRSSGFEANDNDLNSGILKTTNAFLEFLQLDSMSKHLQEMRDRRMFLEKAANDENVTEGDRQVAAWITDTYLSRSPTSNYPQTILENIINRQNNKTEHHEPNHESHTSEPVEITRAHSEDLENKEIAAIIRIADSSILKTKPERAIELLSITGDWNFPVFEYVRICGTSSLALLMATICKSQSYLSALNVPISNLVLYMQAVDKGYKDNTYHNNIHAADVLLNMYYFMKSPIMQNNISQLDAFAILISAAVHDVGHPGHNNHFEINTESTLAVTYNDVSVLENMHICVAWNLLMKSKCNILCNLNKEQRKRFRKVMIDSVLATDMSQHSIHSETLEKLVEEYKGVELIDVEDRNTYKFADEFLPLALHTADLGNLCKDITLYSEWVDRLMNEFFKQGDKERERGLPISFLCDRTKVNIHSGQVGFINFVIRPWFTKFGMLLKEETHNKLWLRHLEDNLKYMQDRANVTKEAQEEIQKKEEMDEETVVSPQHDAEAGSGSDHGIVVVMKEDTQEDLMEMDGGIGGQRKDQEVKVEDTESLDTVQPLPNNGSKPVIYSIGGDDDHPNNSRMSKSYSIVGLTLPEMKTKLLEYADKDRDY